VLHAGTLVTVTIAGEVSAWTPTPADSVLAGVVGQLAEWPLQTIASTIDPGNPLYNAITGKWLHYDYKAVLTVSVPADTFESVDDVGQAVADAFTSVAGSVPTAVQAAYAHGTPDVPSPAGSSFFDTLKLDLGVGAVVIVALIVLIIVAIAWGPNIKVAALA